LFVQVRRLGVGEDQIVPGLRLDFGGPFGGQLQVRDGIDTQADVVLLAERCGELFQALIGGRDEVIPGEHAHLASLCEDRCLSTYQNAQPSGGGYGTDELTARQLR
jgi:hypothetical protein